MYVATHAVKLQGKTRTLFLVFYLLKELSSLRMEVDDYSHRIFEHTCRIAEKSKLI